MTGQPTELGHNASIRVVKDTLADRLLDLDRVYLADDNDGQQAESTKRRGLHLHKERDEIVFSWAHVSGLVSVEDSYNPTTLTYQTVVGKA